MGLQVLSVALNIVLAPLFIFGIGPWPRMGVSGAALATFISILIADVLMVLYFEKKYHYLRFRFSQWPPQMKIWWAMLKIGLPAGAEFALWTLYAMIVYVIIRPFGAAAQAGFGVGGRVMQALFLPVLALSFAVSPVVGAKLRRPARGSRAAIGFRRDRTGFGSHAGTCDHGVVDRANVDPRIFEGSGSDRVRRRIPDDRFAQLSRGRDRLQQLECFPGNREYGAAALEHGVALSAFRVAGGAALAHAGIPDQAGMVRVSRVAGSSGMFQSAAAQAGAGPEAEVRRSVDRRAGQ